MLAVAFQVIQKLLDSVEIRALCGQVLPCQSNKKRVFIVQLLHSVVVLKLTVCCNIKISFSFELSYNQKPLKCRPKVQVLSFCCLLDLSWLVEHSVRHLIMSETPGRLITVVKNNKLQYQWAWLHCRFIVG